MASARQIRAIPIVMTPDQFADLHQAKRLPPEKRLMLAMLEDAIACYQRGPASKLYADARKWILSHDRRWPFSFENVCEALGFHCGWIREGIR